MSYNIQNGFWIIRESPLSLLLAKLSPSYYFGDFFNFLVKFWVPIFLGKFSKNQSEISIILSCIFLKILVSSIEMFEFELIPVVELFRLLGRFDGILEIWQSIIKLEMLESMVSLDVVFLFSSFVMLIDWLWISKTELC